MRDIRRLGWAAAVLATAAGTGSAQQQQQQQGGGGGTGLPNISIPLGSFPTTSGQTGSNTANQSSNSSGGGGDTGSESTLPQFETAPQLARPSTTQTGNPNAAINASNFLANFYGNPYYQGRAGLGTNHATPGGFGAALYNVRSTTGTAAGRGGAAGLAGGLGGRAGGGLNGAGVGRQVVPAQAIAYPAVVKFPVAAVAPAQVQSDLRGMLDRTAASMLSNPAAVRVQVDGGTVTLKGAVRDEDEARLVVGMVRLTPGVRQVTSELTYPPPPQ